MKMDKNNQYKKVNQPKRRRKLRKNSKMENKKYK
jgi:hypothetical protein